MKVAVSFIKSNYDEKETIKLIEQSKADYIHVDIMDGKFVKNKTYTFGDIELFTRGISKPLDVHLMVDNPQMYVRNYSLLNTEYITFHLEAVDNVNKMIDLIHEYGIKCGISIKPNTDIKKLIPYLDKIEQVLIMTVEPGEGGQSFMKDMVKKIDYLLKLKSRNFIVSCDGGINNETIKYVKDIDMVVSGSYVCMSDNYNERINNLK